MAISKSSALVSKKEPAVRKAAPSGEAKKASAKVTLKPEKAPAKKTSSLKATDRAADIQPQAPRKRRSPASETNALVSPELRHSMICEAAYYRAERRGFSAGDPAEDWVAAEAEIDRIYSGKS